MSRKQQTCVAHGQQAEALRLDAAIADNLKGLEYGG